MNQRNLKTGFVLTAMLAAALISLTAKASGEGAVSDTVPPEMEEAVEQLGAAKAALNEALNASALQDLTKSVQTPETPVKVVFVSENQPVHIVDQQGHLIQVIYLKKK